MALYLVSLKFLSPLPLFLIALSFPADLFLPSKKVGFRFAIYAASSAIASAIGGALAYGLQQASAKIAPWKVILLVEGAPPLILAQSSFPTSRHT